MFAIPTVDMSELVGVLSILESLRETGSEYRGVHLKGLERSDSEANNGEILSYLGEQGRKFGELFDHELKWVGQVGADEYDSRIQKALNAAKRSAAKSARVLGKELGLKGKALRSLAQQSSDAVTGFDKTEKWSKQVAGAVLRECMAAYMEWVNEHIVRQVAPGGVKDFSGGQEAPYPTGKKKAVGFKYPIGKRTGQLIENLDPTNAAGRIVLERK